MRACCCALVLTGLALALAPAPASAAAKRRPLPITVSVEAGTPAPPVPADFLGLSFELASLPEVAGYARDANFVTLLRSLGPGVLRFGGVSADTRVAWTDAATPLAPWATGSVNAGDFRQLAALAAQTGWHILLTLGLGHFEPEAAAREAAAAKAALGAWLEGIELGNEPNAWAQHGLRTEPWTVVQYDAQVAAYRAAIEAAAPGIPLAGPDTSGSSAFENWGTSEVVNQRPTLLTGHHYALRCNEQPAPTIARLLSPGTRQLEEASLLRYLTIAQQGETAFRLDETNNVSCGGVEGVSNTFASALWAVGYLTRAMTLGVAGINLHGILANCGGYAPLCAPTPQDLAAGALSVQPEWYAVVLVRALVGERPLQTLIGPTAKHNVQVMAMLRNDGGLHVVVVDDDPPGDRPLLVRLRLGRGFGAASVLALTAPSPTAATGVRLGARTVGPDGSWLAPPALPRAANQRGVVSVRISPSSAMLLTVAHLAG
jgi:hypothetical protein